MRESFEESFMELEKERRRERLTLSKQQPRDCSYMCSSVYSLLLTDNNTNTF